MLRTLLAGVAVCVVAVPCLAQPQLITPTAVTLDAGTEFFPIGNLINNSGLSGTATAANYTTITHANASATSAWVTDAPGGGDADYFALDPAVAPIPQITFDLGGTFSLTDVVTWGYHFGATNGNETKGINVAFSTDGGASFPTAVDIVRTFSAAVADTQSLGGSFTADTVRFTLTDNFFEDAAGGDRVGLGEVKFLGAAIPEPSTLITCGIASIVVGLAVRRRAA